MDGQIITTQTFCHLATVVKPLCLFATHFHEMAQLASELDPLVANVHMGAAVVNDRLTMLYQVKSGSFDKSVTK